MVKLETSMGEIVLELAEKEAPKTVANFLDYVNEGHYDGTVFHRVIDGFMIQGGGMTADMKEKSTREPIENEADNGLKNEPYTIAMMIHRTLGLRLADWQVEILGTDISEKALLAAEKAAYQSYAIRTVKPLVMSRYFKQADGGMYEVAPEIRSMVRFERHNLKDTFAAKRHGVWDVIFCRNVMIYFDQKMRDACIKVFHDQLAPDGTLFIGHSESIRDSKLFTARRESQAFAYAKLDQEEGINAAA